MGTTPQKLEVHVEPLRHNTLQEGVYRQLTELILDGGIAPGQQVKIQSLAEAFGVSTMPVREALKRLTAANALTIISGRTIGVSPLSVERLDDLYNVRLQVESLAAGWAAQNKGEKDISGLKDLIFQMDQAIETGDSKQYLRSNRVFHFGVYRLANSPTLFAMIENLWLQIGPYLSLLRESGNYFSSNVHHKNVLEALEQNNSEAAKNAIRRDIDDAYRVLVGILS